MVSTDKVPAAMVKMVIAAIGRQSGFSLMAAYANTQIRLNNSIGVSQKPRMSLKARYVQSSALTAIHAHENVAGVQP